MPNTRLGIRGPWLGSGLGMAGMALVGVGVGALIFFSMVGVLMVSDVSGTGVLVVVGVLVLGVAVGLWLTHNRYWRGLALGLSGFWVVLPLWLVVDTVFENQDRAEDREQQKAAILASGEPAYYLGEQAQGHDLDWVYANGDAGADGFTFGYGPSECGGEDSGCESDINVHTFSMSRDYFRAYSPCTRVKPVLGVPAATLPAPASLDISLVLFTGNSMIMIQDLDTEDDQRGEMALVPKLRPLGQSRAATELPPPTPASLRFIDQVCGPVP